MNKQQKQMVEQPNQALYKSASTAEKIFGSFLVAAPVSYYQSAKAEAKARSGIPISKTEDFVRRNPFVTAIAGTAALKGLTGSIGKSFKRVSSKVTGKAEKAKSSYAPYKSFFKTSETRSEYLNNLSPETINSIFNEVIS